MKSDKFFVDAGQGPLVAKTVELLQRIIRERTGVALMASERAADATLVLAIEPGAGEEGFRLQHEAGVTTICGNDERGLLYGVGKFLRDSRLEPGNFVPATTNGTFVPQMEVRGIYFATHFFNFYHTAPLPEIARYLEELALWGCNSVGLWFDMHHFQGLDDPAAQTMLVRLCTIARAANEVGIGVALMCLANEAYANSPTELRATPLPSHYHVEICPSLPAGLDQIVALRAAMLEQFADLNIEYVIWGPYDQGGCGCDKCSPWGSNGFLRTAEALGPTVRRILPNAKIVLSTWCFGYYTRDPATGAEPEWEEFYAAMAQRPAWADCVMAGGHTAFPRYILDNGCPGGLPLLNFPEISMACHAPWGGYGAIPVPARLQVLWRECSDLLAGGLPYSEGRYADLNAVLCLQLYWNRLRPTNDIVREYAAYEFSHDVVEPVTTAVQLMEEGRSHLGMLEEGMRRARGALPVAGKPLFEMLQTIRTGIPSHPWRGEILLRRDDPLEALHNANARHCLTLIEEAEKLLPAAIRTSWRWRLLAIRAALDYELAISGGEPTATTEALFDELEQLYYENGQTPWNASVPSSATFKRLAKSTADTREWNA